MKTYISIATCPRCDTGGFGDMTIIKYENDWQCTYFICQHCGYKFLSSEAGMMKGVRIIIDEWADTDCSVKPMLLTGGET